MFPILNIFGKTTVFDKAFQGDQDKYTETEMNHLNPYIYTHNQEIVLLTLHL